MAEFAGLRRARSRRSSARASASGTGPALRGDLEAVLPEIPEIFDRNDVIRALDYVPARTTLLRALDQLKKEGVIAVEDYSPGGITTQYRKTAAAD